MQDQFVKKFMQRNSQLSSLFRMPDADPGLIVSQSNLSGLQIRSQVNGFIQQRIRNGGEVVFKQSMRDAQSALQQLKTKLTGLKVGNNDAEIPEGFKPNSQKTKSFWGRLELGANIQSQKSTYYFPVTSDIGLLTGYKINDNSIIGIG